MENKPLPELNEVFFVHYQCDEFDTNYDTSTPLRIFTLNIYAKDKAIEFNRKSEAENIFDYCEKVNGLIKEGLTLVHWNQNSPNFGDDHIIARYKYLTKKNIKLDYSNSIALSAWLIHEFGDNYISHPRLDSLATLNGYSGHSNERQNKRIYPTNRLTLITKIYNKALNKTLKMDISTSRFFDTTRVPLTEIYELCNNNIFISNDVDFYQMVTEADFSKLNVKTKSKVKRLIFYLAKFMCMDWYNTTASSINFKPTDCSGANVPDTDLWRKEMEKIISDHL